MIRIITDTSALFNIEEGKKLGVEVIPLCVSINDKHYRDLSVSSNEFIEEINKGGIPTSSQPPIGEVISAYESSKDEILHICMAAGLSGTYESACMAKEQVENKDRITVLNSKTLCGPQRYLVEKAVQLRDKGYAMSLIKEQLQKSIDNMHSFLIPQDFEFLKRGGRLSSAASTLGGVLKLKPVMEAVADGSHLDKYCICRTMRKAIDKIADKFFEMEIDENYIIYVSHADAETDAIQIMNELKSRFEHTQIELLELSPAFITQGGPHCLAVQCIKK